MEIKLIANHFLPKKGNLSSEYEDAVSFNKNLTRIAIADGASESPFADKWAKTLVNKAVEESIGEESYQWRHFLEKSRNSFQSKINETIESLPWHSKYKILSEGSFSSLTVLNLDKKRNGFSALSVGDSCLFIVKRDKRQILKERLKEFQILSNRYSLNPYRNKNLKHFSRTLLDAQFVDTAPNKNWQPILSHIRKHLSPLKRTESLISRQSKDSVLHAFPIESPELFNNRPKLIGTLQNKDSNPKLYPFTPLPKGAYHIFIMTDALAQWFLSEVKIHNAKPWINLESLSNAKQFELFINSLRENKQLKNDDVTLLILEAVV